MIDTHYIFRPKILAPVGFGAFVGDVRLILTMTPKEVSLRDPNGLTEPVVTSMVVGLNGDQRNGLDHEPLVIEQETTRSRDRAGVHFEFCKTNGKPYDIAVVAILYSLKHRFPQVIFTSDSSQQELRPGFDLFAHATGEADDLLFEAPQRDRISRAG